MAGRNSSKGPRAEDDRILGGNGPDRLDGDNAAPRYGYGAADFCDGGRGPDTFFVNCELP